MSQAMKLCYVAACGLLVMPGYLGAASWEETVTAAKAEGHVKMYSTMLPGINAALETAFEAAFPEIDLQITRVVGVEVSAMLDAERTTGTDGADIVAHVNFDWIFNPENLARIPEPIGPHASGPGWKGTPYLIEDRIQMSLLTALGIAWNTELVEAEPRNYTDLLRAEFADGMIGLVDNTNGPASDLYTWMAEQFGDDFITRLAAQKPRFYSTAVPLQEALLAGEVSVGVWGSNALVSAAKEKGAPLEFSLGNPGWSTVNLTYLLSWAKRPNAAQVVIDYMASPEGQAVLARGNISTQANVPGTLAEISEITPSNYARTIDPAWLAAAQDKWRKDFGR